MKLICVIFLFLTCEELLADKIKTYDKISDYTMYGMVASPFVYIAFQEDRKEKLIITSIAHGSNLMATAVSKMVSNRLRPDESDKESYWSGHTASSAVSAGLWCSFEPKTCIPAIGLAASVGALRVLAKKHFISDVVMGFYVGFLNGYAVPTLYWNF